MDLSKSSQACNEGSGMGILSSRRIGGLGDFLGAAALDLGMEGRD